ncbi:g13515 [Coccomyxa viridis]|uniref:folate gamma-glutamyl hydrolase n=1 Tax=Coccomyxa viridis TaxID=1274662 RepID=A0ABP1GIE5_9CHLO
MIPAGSARYTLVQTLLLGSLAWCSGARHSGTQAHAGTSVPALPSNTTKRPLIGILSQPGKPAPGNQSYIAASYIKFVEAAGARAVPILCDASPKELERIFKAVNGLLIPGGGQNLSPGHPFYDASAALLKMTLAANDAGDFIPLHGTCLGFEALAIIVSRDANILSSFDSYDNASPLILTEDGQSGSAFFGSLPGDLLQAVQEKPLAMENHGRGLGMKEYNGSKALQDFFKVVSLSVDKGDVTYISTLEGRRYPVTATQWHPEKNAFEWPQHLDVPHSPQAVDLTYAVAKFLVEQARGNAHAPASPQEENGLLIYNYQTTFTGKENPSKPKSESDFDECYFFEPYSDTIGIVQSA